ncbi:MAG TPA: hypothetical protein ENN21_04815 [Spirochaetes bacterium]|nr:hypothetical protein [Spirochaetota bacterium]
MLNKRKKFTLSMITLLALIFGCFKRTDGLKQTDIKPLVSIFLSKHAHYSDFNDELSKRTLTNLFSYIDPGKYYFYKADIEKFRPYETRLDDLIEKGTLSVVFDIFSLYKERFQENMKLFDDLIKQKYDFEKDETINVDKESIDYPRDKSEMRERWRKNIKLQLLNYLTAVKNVDEAKEKLKNKYRLNAKRMEEIDKDRMLSMFMNAFSMALDPHSNYLSQEEHEDFMIQTKLKLEGIGVLLRSEDGFVIVESIIPGGAADKLPEKLKLKPNDKITAVAQGDGDPVDVIDMDLRDVVKLIRGKSGKVVKLTILRKTGEDGKNTAVRPLRFVIPIVREEVKLEDRAARSDIFVVKRGARQIRVGYIKLPSFYLDFDAVQRNDPTAKSSSTDMILQINRLKNLNVSAILLDLRGNPGGALTEAINVAGLFIDQGPILKVKDGNNNEETMSDNDPGVYYDGPLVLLIDRFSASASEIFAGALKDYRRGIILGPSPTFGKGTVQTYNPLPAKKGAVKITTSIFYQPAGTSNQLHGISPDINIPDISSVWEIGENKLKYPLTWEKLKPADYVPYRNYVNQGILDSLKNKSRGRISSDKKFRELIEKIQSLKQKLNMKEISLKEESAMEKKEIQDIQKEMKSDPNDSLINTEKDLFLKEAFDITADYIDMLR